MDFNLQKFSFSSLSMYDKCPLQWRINYVDKLYPNGENIDTLYGRIIHQIIQTILKEYYSGGNAGNPRDFLQSLYDMLQEKLLRVFNDENALKDNTINQENLIQYHEYGIKTIKQFYDKISKYFPVRNWHLEDIEYQLECEYQVDGKKYIYVGFIDVLLYNKSKNLYKIIDLKTSRSTWTENQKKDQMKRMQLILYKYFLSKKMDIPLDNVTVQFFILKKVLFENTKYTMNRFQIVTVPQSKITVEKYKKTMIEIIRRMQNSILNQDFRPIYNSKLCKWCPHYPYKNYCKKGIYHYEQKEKIEDTNNRTLGLQE